MLLITFVPVFKRSDLIFRSLRPTTATFLNYSKRYISSASDKSPKISELRSIGKLIKLAKTENYKILGGIAFLAISSSVTMSMPFCIGRIMDVLFKKSDSELTSDDALKLKKERKDYINTINNLRNFCLGLSIVCVVGSLAMFGRVYLMNYASECIVNRVRTTAFSSILKQEMAFFDKTKTAELINRLSNDVSTVGYATTMNVNDGLRAMVGAVGGTAMMFYLSPELTVIGLAIVPLVAGIAVVYGGYVRSITRQMNDALAESTEIAEEKISNIRTVRAFCAESNEEEIYVEKVNKVLNVSQREAFAKGLYFGFSYLSRSIVLLVLLYNGSNLVAIESITIGDLSSFLLYAIYVGISTDGISGFYKDLMQGVGSAGRLFEILERKPSIPLTGVIEFSDVHYSYPLRKEAPILKGINLKVPAGTTLAIVGSSGSGRTTLASLLLRFYDPDKGSILVDGINITEFDPHWLRSHIGLVSQEHLLFSCSIRDNIAYGSEYMDMVKMHDVERAAKQANAYDFIKSFPNGFNTVLGERGTTLSGGQRQRIAIARALLKDPKILLMDEATSALDAESEHSVSEALNALMHDSERTVIMIAHRLSTIRTADQIAVLADGVVAEIGSYWQLMDIEDGIFRKLIERQTIGSLDDEKNSG